MENERQENRRKGKGGGLMEIKVDYLVVISTSINIKIVIAYLKILIVGSLITIIKICL